MVTLSIISIIKVSALQRFKRIDAEYYQPLFLEYYQMLKSLHSIRLGDKAYAKVADGIHASIEYDPNSGIRCLSAQSVKEGYFDLSANTFISALQHEKSLKTSLHVGDVIISSVGTIGNCAVVTNEILPANADRHVGIVSAAEKLNPFFLCAFLLSKYGRFQTERESTGNVQKNLFIDKMKEILVPILPQQDQIGDTVKQAISLMFDSEKMFQDVQSSFWSLSGLTRTDIEHRLTYSASYQAVRQSHRIDAEYYQPKYEKVLQKIKAVAKRYSWELRSIGEISEPLRYGTSEKLTYLDKGTPFLRITDLQQSDFDKDSLCYISEEEAKKVAYAHVREGDLLISRSGTLGLAASIGKELSDSVFGSYFIRIRPRIDIDRDYLACYLNSVLGRTQVKQVATGTIQTNLTIPTIKNIQVLIPTKEFQKRIAELFKGAKVLRDKAKGYLKGAKTRVENEINKNL